MSLIPATILTGFLGSGKTTLLKRILTEAHGQKIAVIENEFGEENIDSDILVSDTQEQIIQMSNGCVCCTIREDLRTTLQDLAEKKRKGELDFDRVIIETTGLADPAPVIQTLASDTMLGAHYRLDGVVTLVDAANALTQLAEFPEPEHQIALADRIFLTKCDLSTEPAMAELTAAIALINLRADIRRCSQGEIDPADLIGIGLTSARAGDDTLHFLGELKSRTAGDEPAAYLGQRLPARHDPAVKTLSLRFDAPFTWATFSAAMELVISLRGKDLLRVKGIVNVEGNPVVVQGVGHVFHPPLPLDRWPSADTGSRLVFITRNIEEPTLRALFQAVSLMQS